MKKMLSYQPNECLRGSALRADIWDVLDLNPSYIRCPNHSKFYIVFSYASINSY